MPNFREILLFANSQDMADVLEKIRTVFPKINLLPIPRDDCDFYPVGIEVPAEEYDFAEWAIENKILPYCSSLVLKSCDKSCDWMQLLLEAAKLRDEARRLEGS